MKTLRWRACALAVVALSGCGGGDKAPVTAPESPRGALVRTDTYGKIDHDMIDIFAKSSGIESLTGTADCDVELRNVVYQTQAPDGATVTSTASLLVPKGDAAKCQGERPVVGFGHGTSFTQMKNEAAVFTDPENDPLYMMLIFAAKGWVVVAPNYLGHGESSLNFHPYLVSETNGIEVVDALRAATKAQTDSPTKLSKRLFLYGVSEGGYVVMAAHKLIERDYASEFNLLGSMPSAGPYNFFKFYKAMFSNPGKRFDVATQTGVTEGAELLVPMLFKSLQATGGNVWKSPSDVYNAPYDKTTSDLFPTDVPISDLAKTGQIAPPMPAFDQLIGDKRPMRTSFAADVAAGRLPALDEQVKANTLLDWTPKAPMMLCHGPRDRTVPYYNSTDALESFRAKGAKQVGLMNLDDASSLSAAGTIAPAAYAAFQAGYAANPKTETGIDTYHYLFHFVCPVLAKGWFESIR